MEGFTEEHSKCLLGKEWLVRADNHTSTPYLLKFYSSTVDLSCCLLVTDTKSVWAEVLNSNQLARRWRDNQQTSAPPLTEGEEEEAWRATTLELLSNAHTIAGIADASFNVVPTNYSDFAFELDWDSFKWRWQTCFLGHKASAEIISKHLIFPFISVSHFAFSSPDAISAMSDADLEKAVDKVGRTARRTVDTHIKNAISKPRLASTIRRMTAMFDFISELPPVVSNTVTPELRIRADAEPQAARVSSTSHFAGNTLQSASMHRDPIGPLPSLEPIGTNNLQGPADSATESEAEELVFIDNGRPRTPDLMLDATSRVGPNLRTPPVPSASKPASDSESSPIRPLKKAKLRNAAESSSSAEEDSEEERKRRVALVKSGNAAASVKRGTKQPIKRGGKRF